MRGKAGSRQVEGKRNAADFAIWRTTPAGETRQMEWDSPWGRGAPGWHLECSVMSEALLGLPFDIHTGGIDHREIHHPNEIAQNQAHSCSDHSGARIWMHNNFLIDRTSRKSGAKMSKSSGEFLRVPLLVDKGFHPLAYRLMCLQAHYRSELEFTWEGLQAALTRLKRINRNVKTKQATMLYEAEDNNINPDDEVVFDDNVKAFLKTFEENICNDLNTSEAIIALEQMLGTKFLDTRQVVRASHKMNEVLGLKLFSGDWRSLRVKPKNAVITESEINQSLQVRNAARKQKDFKTSDEIRDTLASKGVEVMDGDPLGWDWKLL